MKNLAPIVLFTYNRPWHTRKTLEALSENILAEQSDLIVYSDGPKENETNENIKKIEEVRSIILEKQWCKNVKLISSGKNKGLARSIIEGVTTIVNQYGKIIVLEDDIITSSKFLVFINSALDHFANIKEVACISGYTFPVKNDKENFYFLKSGACWGWGTWARGWEILEQDVSKLIMGLKSQNFIFDLDFNNSYPYFEILEKELRAYKSWAIRWYASIYLANKLTLYSPISLTQNIGFDGSGTNCGLDIDRPYQIDRIIQDEFRFDNIDLLEDKTLRNKVAMHLKKDYKKKNLMVRIIDFLLKSYKLKKRQETFKI
jgi:hypothetical protein